MPEAFSVCLSGIVGQLKPVPFLTINNMVRLSWDIFSITPKKSLYYIYLYQISLLTNLPGYHLLSKIAAIQSFTSKVKSVAPISGDIFDAEFDLIS